jgi:hypothetical protein
VIGQRFRIAKRHVAMLCVGLCLALSVQMTMVVLDRLQHVFQVEHAPNALAGAVFDHGHHTKTEIQPVSDHSHADAEPGHVHGHEIAFSPDVTHTHEHDGVASHYHAVDDSDDVAPAHEHDAPPQGFHTHDGLPQGHTHGPITHHHHGTGMLTPWLVSTPIQISPLPIRIPVLDHGVTGHPDAPAWRRDRPPKPNLERTV